MPPLSSTASTSVVWDDEHESVPGDQAAVLALTRADWVALGARFVAFQDTIGGTGYRATGRVDRSDDESVRFGVLDYDGDSSYLTASSWEDADVAIVALVAAGVSPAAILERIPLSAEQVLEGRVAAIERWIERQGTRA
jgi:hypothetical protein